jgi:hypothetical protein
LGLVLVALASSWAGCAGVKSQTTTGAGGTGGSTVTAPPCVSGLQSLTVTPDTQTVNLTLDQMTGQFSSATKSFQAMGKFADGTTMDVTDKVGWPTAFGTLLVSNGTATVSGPGTYTISAKCGNITGSAKLVATFQGSVNDGSIAPTDKTALDNGASGSAPIAYPLDGALFPSNLSPITVQVQASGTPTAGRLEFASTDGVVDIMWYGPCAPGMPGGGCNVVLPLAFTKLLIPSSEAGDFSLTARVTAGGTTAQSQTIKVAWSNVQLQGGLYYWTTIDPVSIPGYTPADSPPCGAPSTGVGTGIMRYNFANDNPVPELVWTDCGPPPTFPGAPQSFVGSTAGSHCIGCHAITTDGKYMALTIGGSSQMDGANWSILDITAKSLLIINPTARTDPNSSPTSDPTDYFKQFRNVNIGAETAWGPDGTVMVTMLQSKLYFNSVAINSPNGNTAQTGPAFPSKFASEYETDPYWSQQGGFFVYTSFPTPDMGVYNTLGTNGDEKKGGQIMLATAEAKAVHDDGKPLVPYVPGATLFYPSVSSDDQLVVYNQSTCGADPDINRLPPQGCAAEYGNQTCDGYDDSSASLWLTKTSGGTPVALARANGQGSVDNSWPRFSPDKGTFRGQTLYWVAFSSRRAYGLQVNNTNVPSNTKPQLWFAGVLTGGEFPGDPSFSPVWLPGQNPNQSVPGGNHVPQWVPVAVPIPP